jgi:hypothetical protein
MVNILYKGYGKFRSNPKNKKLAILFKLKLLEVLWFELKNY